MYPHVYPRVNDIRETDVSFRIRTCDDRPMGRPATGQGPGRNVRVHRDLWDAHLALAALRGGNVSERINELLEEDAETAPAGKLVTYGNWPKAREWRDGNPPAWLAPLTDELERAPVGSPGEYVTIAAWRAVTLYPEDRRAQARLITGFITLAARQDPDGEWASRHPGIRQFDEVVRGIVNRALNVGG